MSIYPGHLGTRNRGMGALHGACTTHPWPAESTNTTEKDATNKTGQWEQAALGTWEQTGAPGTAQYLAPTHSNYIKVSCSLQKKPHKNQKSPTKSFKVTISKAISRQALNSHVQGVEGRACSGLGHGRIQPLTFPAQAATDKKINCISWKCAQNN